jgi:GNAT superfamily N-acetyltransferase
MDVEFHGYYPGVVGKIIESHAVYYFENWGFDVTFETQVGRELSEFVSNFDKNRDSLWVVTRQKKFAGALAIDGRQAVTEGVRLRWFIVEPKFQNIGIGKSLIRKAVEFCKKKRYPKVYLWTFKGLESARRLYEAADFRLCEESDVLQWGQNIKEQKYELALPASLLNNR